MPVWDPELNPSRKDGNDFTTWSRSIVVRLPGDADARSIRRDTFQHFIVDERLANQIMQDTLARKAAAIALGRSLKAGDSLALVAMHVATKQNDGWIWTTLWWHDHPAEGPFARDRPAALPGA